jgi:molybdopterin molybdotransferase
VAQLSDDCFAFGGALMQADAALALLTERVRPVVGIETVGLDAACGRVLARALVAQRSVPPHDNAAVDGFAVRSADLGPGATQLPISGRVAAGHWLDAIEPGEAVRIFTGAPMPEGMDSVFMQEDCRVDGAHVILPPGLKPGSNRRKAGEDVRLGEPLLEAGTRLRPQEVGLIAAQGWTEVSVFRRLRVALFSTGDELREPGQPLPQGAIYDANRFMLAAQLRAFGCAVVDLGVLPDRLPDIAGAMVRAAEEADAIVTSGGMSTGEEDHVRAAVEAAGQIHFWRLAIRPGRPVAFGTAHGRAFVGLPGNPVAALVTCLRFARPVLLRLAGQVDVAPLMMKAIAGFAAKKKFGRREWLRCRLGSDGALERYSKDGAGILRSLSFADGLAEIPEEVTEIKPGDPLDFLPFSVVST